MSDVKVHLGGEGKNELGSCALAEPYQSADIPGVVETLLRRVEPAGWTVAGATPWKSIRKFSARGPMSAEERNVRGLVEKAAGLGIPVVAFVRDSDGEPDRIVEIDAAIAKAAVDFPAVQVIGGTANPVLEGWILALQGVHGTEKLGKARAQTQLNFDKNTEAMTQVASTADLERLPKDASSLNGWMKRAAEVLTPLVRHTESP